MTASISFQNVHLYYPTWIYRENSLKAFIFQKLSNKIKTKVEDIHALKDVSFEIKNGERVALMGHNGAGKSTLLKTMASLYPVAEGQVSIKGHVRSLFELILGFEPEATGRENIMYRGLLLGSRPGDIRQMTDEIIEFADLGPFIDYPVKTYSAGMQVRLAFAISTAIDGEILLLDEIIGAGDAQFLIKAKKRIQSLIARSQILVLASHSPETVLELCTRGIILYQGKLVFDGPVSEALQFYRSSYKA